jgi:hypothetical protein
MRERWPVRIHAASAHSVEPISPSSSPSQLAKIIVRFGFQPDFRQLADPVDRFEHRRRAAVRIDRAIDPRVAMIARNHPLIGRLAAAHPANHIPKRAELIVLLEMHPHSYRSGPHVISKGQRTLPLAWRVRPAQVLQNGPRIVIGKRSNRNLRHLRGLLGRNALTLWQRRH